MIYLFELIGKLFYTGFYILKIAFSFLFRFSAKDIDWSTPTIDLITHKEESDGYRCKNIIDMWMRKFTYSDEVLENYKNSIEDTY